MSSSLKKIFIYVSNSSSTKDTSTLKDEIKTLSSQEEYNDKIFFIADSNEIITHGHVFGSSSEVIKRLDNLDDAFLKLAGYKIGDNEAYVISEDSDLAKYVKAHMSTIISDNETYNPITVDPSEATESGITYTLSFDSSKIVDDKTIKSDKGLLKSAIQLVKKYTNEANPTKDTTFSDDKTEGSHPVILMTDADGSVLDVIDGAEFVADGMLESVEWENDKTGHILVFTWKLADGSSKTTKIDIANFFNIQSITSLNKYVTIDQSKHIPTEDGDDTDKFEYTVKANVSDVDLTKNSSSGATTLGIKTLNDGTYAIDMDEDVAHTGTVVSIGENELADAKKTASKFVDITKSIITVGNDAIAREKSLTTDIEDKLSKLRAALDSATGDDTSVDDYAPSVMTLKSAGDAIEVLNGEETVDGSVKKTVADKIAALKEELNESLSVISKVGATIDTLGAKETNLAKIDLSQVDGKIADLKLTLAANTLGTDTAIHESDKPDWTYTYGADTLNYFIKSFETIAQENPALVTTQDAWIYGQAIMNKTISKIEDDTNGYIHIEYDATKGHPVINYEPWYSKEISDWNSWDDFLKDAKN